MDWATLFSSSSRFKTLEILCPRQTPLPLRHIAELTNLHVHSIENALASLEKEKIIKKTRSGKFIFFQINRAHKYFETIKQIFALVQHQVSSMSYDHRAKWVLKFSDSGRKLFDPLKIKP